jgi:hypothetical protein
MFYAGLSADSTRCSALGIGKGRQLLVFQLETKLPV